MMKLRLSMTLLLALVLAASAARAVQPVTWTHTTEADFAAGEVDRTVVTSLGDLKLAVGSSVLGEIDNAGTILNDVESVAGVTYLAAGPQGRLLKLDGDQWVEVVALEGEQIFALARHEEQLFVAVSGERTSRLAALQADGSLKTLVELAQARYIWDVVHLENDEFALATGIEGKVLLAAVNDATVTELLDAEQANVLSLALGKAGLFAGTDTDGLVYRITLGDKRETFVVYDADEPEIGALLAVEDVLYVGTADAEQARPGRLEEAGDAETGRPDDILENESDNPDEDGPPAMPSVPDADPPPQPLEQDATPADPAVEPAAEEVAIEELVAEELVAEDPAPTSEQYDALRELMRDRLDDARAGGSLEVEGLDSPDSIDEPFPGGGSPGSVSSPRARPPREPEQTREGNAVYRLDGDGFVREVFRDSVMILRLIESRPGGAILVLTGNEGQVYRVDVDAEETTVLADLDNEQAVAALVEADGSVLIAAANPAQLVRLDSRFAPTGTYTSPPLDAGQVSLFGTLTVTGPIPDGASVTVETRSGNTSDPQIAAWSAWSSPQVFMSHAELPQLQPREMKIVSPPARFLQYRLTLSGDVDHSPAIEKIEATCVTPNLAPAVTSLTTEYAEAGIPDEPPSTEMTLSWEAADPNNDPMLYKLEYRPAGSDSFLPLAKQITETSHAWQTRHVPDGWYLLRVTADDAPANPGTMARQAARLTDAVLVDNTAPRLEAAAQRQGATLTITGRAEDAWSRIRGLAYLIDGQLPYLSILPTDLIFDSTNEPFVVTICDLAPGPHVVTLRGYDERGNVTHHAVLVK